MEIIDVEINGNYEPLVSVLMTAYNREIFIKESVESVIHSTYKNIELIIVDDGSTDNTIDVVKALMLNDKRIKLFQNENNLGDYPNRNKAAGYAIGKYMLYVDSDDTIQPDAIEYCVKNLELYSTSDFSVIYPHQDIRSPQLLNATSSIRKHFFEKSFLNLGPGGVVFKRDFFFSNGMYSIKYGPANDLYSHLKFASKGYVLLLPYRYLNYRIHDGQESTNKYRYLYLNQNYINGVFEDLNLPLSTKEKRQTKKRYSRNNFITIIKYILKTGNLMKGISAVRKANFSFSDLL